MDRPNHGRDRRGQPYGPETKAWLEQYLDAWVAIKPTGYDRYNRTLADVYCKEKHLNLEMARAGLAWWYKRYAPKAEYLARAEAAARAAKLGLWSNPVAVHPEIHRRVTK